MRLYQMALLNEHVEGTTPIDTSQESSEALARAKIIVLHIVATQGAGTSPTLTVKAMHGGDGRRWVDAVTLVNAQSLASTPYEVIVDTSSVELAGFVKFQVTLGGTTPSAYIQITATGRSA